MLTTGIKIAKTTLYRAGAIAAGAAILTETVLLCRWRKAEKEMKNQLASMKAADTMEEAKETETKAENENK